MDAMAHRTRNTVPLAHQSYDGAHALGRIVADHGSDGWRKVA